MFLPILHILEGIILGISSTFLLILFLGSIVCYSEKSFNSRIEQTSFYTLYLIIVIAYLLSFLHDEYITELRVIPTLYIASFSSIVFAISIMFLIFYYRCTVVSAIGKILSPIILALCTVALLYYQHLSSQFTTAI